MKHCNGCSKKVADPIILDDHCNLPYCKDCIIKLENSQGKGKIYSDEFKTLGDRKCDRCHKTIYKGFLVEHKGHYSYDCTFCKSCIEFFNKLIQHLKENK